MVSLPTRWMLRLAPFAALLFAADALAALGDARKVRLEYVRGKGAEECADEEVLAHIIRTQTKDEPFSPTAKALLRVVIVATGKGFKSSYELRDDNGKVILARSLPPEKECFQALETAGFSVGVFMPPFLTGSVGPKPPPKPRPYPPPLPEPPFTVADPEPSPQIRPKLSRNAAWEDTSSPKAFINWISRSSGIGGFQKQCAGRSAHQGEPMEQRPDADDHECTRRPALWRRPS